MLNTSNDRQAAISTAIKEMGADDQPGFSAYGDDMAEAIFTGQASGGGIWIGCNNAYVGHAAWESAASAAGLKPGDGGLYEATVHDTAEVVAAHIDALLASVAGDDYELTLM